MIKRKTQHIIGTDLQRVFDVAGLTTTNLHIALEFRKVLSHFWERRTCLDLVVYCVYFGRGETHEGGRRLGGAFSDARFRRAGSEMEPSRHALEAGFKVNDQQIARLLLRGSVDRRAEFLKIGPKKVPSGSVCRSSTT
jgi:hypothetical protein